MNKRWLHILTPLLHHPFILIPFCVYLATMSRSFGHPDTVILLQEMQACTLASPAYSHNLAQLLGFLFQFLPFGDAFIRANLLSVVAGGLAVSLFYGVVYKLGANRLTAALTASVFMVSHSQWWHSTIVENYALSTACLMGVLLLALADLEVAVRRPRPLGRLLGLWCLAGFSLFNHVQNGAILLGVAAYTVLVLKTLQPRPVRSVLFCLAAGVAGLLPYLALIVKDAVASDDWAGTFHRMAGGGFTAQMFAYRGSAVGGLWHLIVMQFPSPFLAAIPVGFALLARDKARRPFALLLAVILIVTSAFFMGYPQWDQFAFYLPAFVVLAVSGAYAVRLAVARLLGPVAGSPHGLTVGVLGLYFLLFLCILLPPYVYSHIGRWTDSTPGGYWGRRYARIAADYRARYDFVEYLANPDRRGYWAIERYCRHLLTTLPADTILIDDASSYFQLQYLQKSQDFRPDIQLALIRPPHGFDDLGNTPEEIADYVRANARCPAYITTIRGPSEVVIQVLGRRPIQDAQTQAYWLRK